MHSKIIIILANEQRGRTTQTFTHAQPGKQGGEGRKGGGEGREGRGGEEERSGGAEGWKGGVEFEASGQRGLAGRRADVPCGS